MTNLAFPPLPAHCRDDDDLAAKMTLLAGQINAANHRLLRLIAEFDRRKAWSGGGTVRSCTHWLNWQCGIAMGAAREKVRVAHCLETLPQIDAAFAAGEVSCSKVRAMTRVATAGQDASYQGLRGSERCQVVLHVDINTLREQPEVTTCAHEHCHLDEKPWISTNTARRLACDASLDNLVTLCRYHHRQLHRGSFTLALEKNRQGVTVAICHAIGKTNRNRLFSPVPQRLRGDVPGCAAIRGPAGRLPHVHHRLAGRKL